MSDYVLRKAAAQYRTLGVLTLDMMVALERVGLVIEDVINYIEEAA